MYSFNLTFIKNTMLSVLLLLGLVSCDAVSSPVTMTPTSTPVPVYIPMSTTTPTPKPTLIVTPTDTGYYIEDVQPPCGDYYTFARICMRWFVGLGTGTEPEQLKIEQALVDHFNESQHKILLELEVVPYASAADTILVEIASGNGPDIIGPITWRQSGAVLHGQLKDLGTQLANSSEIKLAFDPALLNGYKTPEGQIALPLSVYPSAIFYNAALFDRAGLAYPPSSYSTDLGPAIYQLDGRDVEWNWDTIREVSRRLTIDSSGRNATQAGFDKGNILQYGFSWVFENHPSYMGTFWGNGTYSPDGNTAQLPAVWKESWAWTYDGIWGDQPFIPNAETTARFDGENPFNGSKVAMTDAPLWFTCCIDKVKGWDMGVLPAYKGKVAGRLDSYFFVMWKSTRHPDEAFQVLTYLATADDIQKLFPTSYSMPARKADQAAWLDARKAQFPWVKHWDVMLTNLSFIDSPNAEAYMPNYTKAWDRGQQFYDLLTSTSGLDLKQEEHRFLLDLQALFDEK